MRPSGSVASAASLGAGLMIASAFLGVFPLNLVSIITVVTTGVYLWRDRPQLQRPTWIWPIVVWLSIRFAAASVSADVAVSLRALAHDWHIVALTLGACGLLSPWRLMLERAVGVTALASVGYAAAQFLDIRPIIDLIGKELPGPAQTGSFLGLTLTLGGVSALTLAALPLLRPATAQRRLLIACTVVLVLISGARAYWLALIFAGVTAVAMGLVSWKRAVPISLFLVSVVALTPSTRERVIQTVVQVDQIQINYGSIARRFELWQASVELGSRQLLGVGPGRFHEMVQPLLKSPWGSSAHAHNNYFHALAETGFPGALSLLAAHLWLLVLLIQSARKQRALLFAPWLVFMIAGLFEVNMYDAEVATLAYLLTGHALWLAGYGLIPRSAAVPSSNNSGHSEP